MPADLKDKVKAALQAAEKAHHQAFLDQDGQDPEWPLWYADYLKSDLQGLLSKNFSQSELVYLLLAATYEQQEQAPGQPWPEYTAKFLISRYG